MFPAPVLPRSNVPNGFLSPPHAASRRQPKARNCSRTPLTHGPISPLVTCPMADGSCLTYTLPHSALNGRTPDEVYFGKGEDIPVKLAAARQAARARRLAENRAVTCATCMATSEPTTAFENAA